MWALPSEQHTGPWRHEGHAQRPDTRPIEDPADKSKIPLAKPGASTHAVDPNAWLADTLACIPDYKITKVDDLLPWRWNG